MNSSNELNEQVSALQRQVFALLLALIVVSGTLTVYLYRQASLTRKDTDALQQQAGPVIAIFRQNQAAMINFVNQLVIYSQTHPDFRPVLLKFGITPPTSEPRK
jgi:hypothetical protein